MTEVTTSKTGQKVCSHHAQCVVCFKCQIEDDDVVQNVPFVLVNKLWTCFCKYFNLSLSEWEDIVTLYLNSKQLPFCTKCRNTVAELFVLDEKLDSVRKKINRLHSSLTTTIIDTSSPINDDVNSTSCDAWKGVVNNDDDDDSNKEKDGNESKVDDNGGEETTTTTTKLIKLIKQEPKPIIPRSPEIDKRLIELRENIYKRYNPKLVLVNCKEKTLEEEEEEETLSKQQQQQPSKSASLTFLENFRKNLNSITKPNPIRSVSLKRTSKPYVPKKVQIQKKNDEDLNKTIHNNNMNNGTKRINPVNEMNSNPIQVKIENHYGNILTNNDSEENGALVPFPSSSDAVDPFQDTNNDNYFINENNEMDTEGGDNFVNYEDVNNYFIPEMEGNLWAEEESPHVLNEEEEEEELGGDQVIEQDGIFHYGIWTYVQLEEDESFRCLKCGGSQNSHSKMIQHIQLEHKFKNSNKEFMGEENSIEEDEDGNSTELIKCTEPGCNKLYKSQNGLALHRRTAHSNFHYSCPECQRTFTQKHSLMNHLKSFHPTLTLPQEYFDSLNLRRRSNPMSTVPSTSSSSLNNEMQITASNSLLSLDKENKSYKCTESGCTKSYSTYTGLYIHKRHSHGVIKPYSCTLCPRSFAHEGFLNVHLQNAHLQDKDEYSSDPVLKPKYSTVGKFKCKEPNCGKSYKSYQGLYTHRLLHTSSEILRIHKCHLCPRSFSSKGYLRFHLKVLHQITIFPEDDEEEGLVEENDTNNGEEVNNQNETSETPPIKRKVGRPKSIKVTVASTGKLWHCQVPNCGKTYNSYQGLYIHRRHHSSVKPFSCTICNKPFIQKTHLFQHYKTHHVGEIVNEGEDDGIEGQQESNWDSYVIQNRVPAKRPYRKRGSLKIGDDWACSFPGCGRLYKSYQGMYLHRRAHDEILDESSTTTTTTENRVKTVKQRGTYKEGGEIFKCNQEGCEKEYKSYQGLYIHMKMHTGDSLVCPEGCGKEFYQKQNLQYHLTHTHGYKNFKNVKKTKKKKRGRPKTKGKNWKNWNMNYKGKGTDDEDEPESDDQFFHDESELIMN